MRDLILFLTAVMLLLGFAAGYGARELVSRVRRNRYRETYDSLVRQQPSQSAPKSQFKTFGPERNTEEASAPASLSPRSACERCDDTYWVCESHPDRPWNGPRACGCGAAGMPCELCNPTSGPDDPPDITRTGVRVSVDREHGPWH